MKIIKLKKDNFQKAINLAKKTLDNNGLVVIPSDTVYVLAGKATSSKVAKKILDFKGRRFSKGISIFLKSINEIGDYAHFDKNQARIIKTLLPGFFTVVLKSKGKIVRELEPGDNTIGIRVIDHQFVNQLLAAIGFPITATSANTAGRGPHYSIFSFLRTLSGKKKAMLGLVIEAGKLPRFSPSTVVRLAKEEIKILRKGILNPKLILTQRTRTEAATKKLAQKIYQEFLKKELKNKAVVVILRGELGVGKTVFAQGLGEFFNQQFFSPTFVLLDEYPINQPPVKSIYHADLFRLETDEEVQDLELEKFLTPGNLLLIEWGEKLLSLQTLKSKNTAFFWLQIEEEKRVRKFKLYKV